jgi:hypothetical protein
MLFTTMTFLALNPLSVKCLDSILVLNCISGHQEACDIHSFCKPECTDTLLLLYISLCSSVILLFFVQHIVVFRISTFGEVPWLIDMLIMVGELMADGTFNGILVFAMLQNL